jgi:CRP-like cAMP-binding protein
VFCSELVAGFYQYLGILLPYPTSKSYLPKHFSTGYDEYLKLQNSCNLLPEVSLRKDLEENYQKYRDLVKDELERCPNSEETNLIVNCLRRHALFHTLNECDLVRIAHKFRRKVLEGDEVLFYQGMEGDFFYVVEQGECDVLIDYDHLIKMNVPLWEGYEMYESSMENPKMVMEGDISIRRHKTVSLPEFQSSVQILGKDPYVLVATNGPGNAFGDSALIYGTPRRATVRGNSKDTKRKIILWRLDKTHFQEAVAEHTGSQASLEERHFLMRVISGHPLFSELDDRAKALAVRKSFSLGVKKGSLIINQGDPGDYFYIIESGKCEISRKKPSHGMSNCENSVSVL